MYRRLELAFLKLEHQTIRLFRLNRMSHNLIWLALGLGVFVGFLSAWLFSLHARPDTEYILIRDPSITSGHAEVYYEGDSFYFRPLEGKVLFNSQEIHRAAPLKEGDQFILGHTILQLLDTAGWLPRLKVVGYYLDDRMMHSEKISIGRSDQPEEANHWEPNDLVISDTSFEPIQLWIHPERGAGTQEPLKFSIENRGKKSVELSRSGSQDWSSIRNKEPLKLGDKIRLGDSILQFTVSRTGKGAELQILRGRAQSYRIYLHKRNILSGSHTIPGGYIPDALVDEEFLEGVRRCIEARLLYLVREDLEGRKQKAGNREGEAGEAVRPQAPDLDPEAFKLRVKGFTRDGKLVKAEFDALTRQEKRLLEQVFLFSTSPGSRLKWKRPFNRNQEDPYLFDGTELENFIITDGELKGIYSFAARLVSPHILQRELSVERGSMYDRDRQTLPRLMLSNPEAIRLEPDGDKPQTRPVTLPVKGPVQFLLIDSEDRNTVVEIDLSKPLENKIYVAGGYIFLRPVPTPKPNRVASKERVIVKRSGDRVELALDCSPVKPPQVAAQRTGPLPPPDLTAFDPTPARGLLPDYTCAEQKALAEGDAFSLGELNFTYQGPASGLLAGNKGGQPPTGNGQRPADRGQRYYPLGEKLVHIIGYSYPRSNFKRNLEDIFDDILLGKERAAPWYHFAPKVESHKGNNLILTLDDDLQQILYEALKKKLDELNQNADAKGPNPKELEMKDEGPDVESEEYAKVNVFRGAAIAINAEGEILASVSLPTYDPHDIHSILAALKESSLDNWNSSFINRAFHKIYPPGSTFKLIMASLALEHKDQFLWENRNYLIKDGAGGFICNGLLTSFEGVRLGKPIPDFRRGRHGGPLLLEDALAESCNNAFAFLALKAGRGLITEYAERYGFNQLEDLFPISVFKGDLESIGLIHRSEGDTLFALKSQVPEPGQEIQISQLGRMGIGQWQIEATPLEMALVAMTLANSGLRPYPHLVKGFENGETGEVTYFHYPDKKRVLSREAAEALKPMMQKVVQKGTAIRLSMSKVPYYSLKDHVIGKTGTAEVEGEDGKKTNIAWFVSVAPIENPQLAIAIVIEKGAIISREPVMVARDVWERAVLLYRDRFPQTEPLNSLSRSQAADGREDAEVRRSPDPLKTPREEAGQGQLPRRPSPVPPRRTELPPLRLR